MERSEEDILKELVAENRKRNYEMFEGFNPWTGRGCPGKRTKVSITGFPLKSFLMPNRCWRNEMWKKIRKYNDIDKFLNYEMKMEANDLNRKMVIQMIIRIRATEDPAFAFACFYKIQYKKDNKYGRAGTMGPFILNYGQRKILERCEKMRLEGRPIRLIILKARQVGGSTFSQGYEKWISDFLHVGWNIAILAHVKDATKRIKAMFTKMLENQPGWSIGAIGEQLLFSPYEKSSNDFIVTNTKGEVRRNTVVSVASFENYDSLRSADYKQAHYSEVAYWKATPGKEPEEVLSSIDGGIPLDPDTCEIMESSGKNASGLFYEYYKASKDPDMPSIWDHLAIFYYMSENDRLPVNDQMGFARWLWENRENPQNPKGYLETGIFFWKQWKKGASFEAINWYRVRRNSVRSHVRLATEAPSDDVEAFQTSGSLIFDMYSLEAMEEKYKRDPISVGDILSENADTGVSAIKTAQYEENAVGPLRIWKFPDNVLKVSNRYIVSVDIGGVHDKSDFTVMTVIDRLGQMASLGGRPKVVARWRGHIKHSLLAWKAAMLAEYYNHAMLVIESNTADTDKGKYTEDNMGTEGDHFLTIIEKLAPSYNNLYIRQSTEDSITHEVKNQYGFNTNVKTKQQVIDTLSDLIDEQDYDEPDKLFYDEARIYERHEDNSLGNAIGPGNHDDIVMSTAIGLFVSLVKMPAPAFISRKSSTGLHKIMNESTF